MHVAALTILVHQPFETVTIDSFFHMHVVAVSISHTFEVIQSPLQTTLIIMVIRYFVFIPPVILPTHSRNLLGVTSLCDLIVPSSFIVPISLVVFQLISSLCHNSQGFRYYARDCQRKKETRAKDNDEMQYAHAEDSDYDSVFLISNTQSNTEQTNMWYLYSGCSNHMTGNKIWFTKLDGSFEKVVKFADDRHITSGGKGDIFVVRKDGRKANITYVLCVPSMINNLISVGQLLAKEYNMKLEKN
ncbi:hypothetical protein KIW84_063940 [Lathyrus oleraceus]|uniref:Retrovirus-related Pol polyprotein from transposon TNT 1-94-like beta-barrel domain-containing protein n=1 Tax=Pisum sativum TaxID=3888 RepID=A0A9D4WB63_PEA|nr:hypothetical protein KIW84_063940 [Pisum sativum]